MEALKQLGIDPQQAEALQREMETLMADPVKRTAMETMQQRLQGAMAKLQGDPEMKDFLEDVQKNGMGAMQKYAKDERIMKKIQEATAGIEDLATAVGLPGGAGGGAPTGPGALPGAPVAVWQPGEAAIVQGLQSRPELNGQQAMVVPANAEERETIKGTGRVVVRLLSSGEQFAVKPDNLRRDSGMAPASGGEQGVTSAALAAAARLRESGKLEEMERDPELKPILEDIRKNGMAALQKYWSDEKLMAKISGAMGAADAAA